MAIGIGAAMLGASAIGAGSSFLGTQMTNSAATAASKKQMNFQRWMSNTAYRRAARDMEKAGLNRILALGGPASTPTGSQPSLNDLGGSLTSGAQLGATVANVAAQTQKVRNENFFNSRGIKFFRSLPKGIQRVVDAANVSDATGIDTKILLGSSLAEDVQKTKVYQALTNPKNYGEIGKKFENAGGWRGIWDKFKKGAYTGVPEYKNQKMMKAVDNRIYYRGGKPGTYNRAGKWTPLKKEGPTRQRIFDQR